MVSSDTLILCAEGRRDLADMVARLSDLRRHLKLDVVIVELPEAGEQLLRSEHAAPALDLLRDLVAECENVTDIDQPWYTPDPFEAQIVQRHEWDGHCGDLRGRLVQLEEKTGVAMRGVPEHDLPEARPPKARRARPRRPKA